MYVALCGIVGTGNVLCSGSRSADFMAEHHLLGLGVIGRHSDGECPVTETPDIDSTGGCRFAAKESTDGIVGSGKRLAD